MTESRYSYTSDRYNLPSGCEVRPTITTPALVAPAPEISPVPVESHSKTGDHGRQVPLIDQLRTAIPDLPVCLLVLPIDRLMIDQTYQRKLSPSHKRIARNWNRRAAGMLIIGRRPDGSLWVIDGQQRLGAMRILGVSSWPCQVIDTAGAEDEAKIFSILNGGRTALTGRDVFRSRLASNEPLALLVCQICNECGFRFSLSSNCGTNEIGALSTIYAIASTDDGPEILRKTLRLIRSAWPGDRSAIQATYLRGVAYFFSKHGGRIDERRAINVFVKYTADRIIQDAKRTIGGDLSSNITRALTRLYNTRLNAKNRLPVEE